MVKLKCEVQMQMEEKKYRELVKEVFEKIEKGFESIDPDAAEVEVSQGTLRIQFAKGGPCILSPQPSVRQVWLAVASKGVAFHFNFDGNQWVEDKGRGIELLKWLQQYVNEVSGVEVSFLT